MELLPAPTRTTDKALSNGSVDDFVLQKGPLQPGALVSGLGQQRPGDDQKLVLVFICALQMGVVAVDAADDVVSLVHCGSPLIL